MRKLKQWGHLIDRSIKGKFRMQIRKNIRGARALVAAIVLVSSAAASAAELVSVRNAWVRATVPGQGVAGAYMEITATAPAVLLAVESPLARKTGLHTMAMDAGVMKMRPVVRIELPAHQTVSLKPGGYHVMLIDIKRELKPGERVPLELTLRTRQGVKSTLQIEAEVRAVTGATVGHHQRH